MSAEFIRELKEWLNTRREAYVKADNFDSAASIDEVIYKIAKWQSKAAPTVGGGYVVRTVKSQSDDGWVLWEAGECPVAPDTFVEAKCDDGFYVRGHAKTLGWGLGSGIAKYRIVKPADSAKDTLLPESKLSPSVSVPKYTKPARQPIALHINDFLQNPECFIDQLNDKLNEQDARLDMLEVKDAN